MSNKVRRDTYAPLLEDTLEALSMNPIQTFEKEIPDKSKRKLRVSISVAVSSGSNEAAGGAECNLNVPDAGCKAKCPPPKPPRRMARSPFEEPLGGDTKNVGAALDAGGLCSNGLPEQQNCPDSCTYLCDGGADGLLPCCRACQASTMHDCSLDGCSLAADTNSVDTLSDDWPDSVSSYITSRCFATRLVNYFCCLKPHDD